MTSHNARTGILVIFCAALAAMVASWPSVSRAQEGASAPPVADETPVASSPTEKIVGVWKGVTQARCSVLLPPDRCNAQQKVTISLIQGADERIKGFYKCAYGNQDCFHQQQTGKVESATINGSALMIRMMIPDGTGYIFNGRISGDTVNGSYTASSGGAVLERGSWRARKTD